MRQLVFFIIVFPLTFCIKAQSSSRWGALPEFTISKKTSPKSGLSLQIEPMIQLGFQAPSERITFDERHIRTDLTFFYSYSLNPNWKIAGGLMYRLRNGNDLKRTIQQLSYSKRSSSFRYGHRLRADQSYVQDLSTVWRFRYRFSVELPLQGADLNDREFYLISSVEMLFITTRDQSAFEQRLAANLGYYINRSNKFEIGIDYRAGDIFEVLNVHQTWLSINYFLNL